MHTSIQALFDQLWQQFVAITPSAQAIHKLLAQGKPIINDHIALRTFNLAPVGLDVLARHFTQLGYTLGDEYEFKQKKLYAKHFEPPSADLPKVFISELLVELCSTELQQTVAQLVAQVDVDTTQADNFLYSGRHWPVSSQQYQALLGESEYAAWLAAWGYRANHFTVSINQLAGFDDIKSVNNRLKQSGFNLNQSGGEIKGSAQVMLEQSATLADHAEVSFSDAKLTIPGCFYEFALRYKQANGELFSGFVEASADKIFDSTNNKVN